MRATGSPEHSKKSSNTTKASTAVIDGEIVPLDENGVQWFEQLQNIPAIVGRPQKTKAEQTVKAVRGVKSVDDQIVVLG